MRQSQLYGQIFIYILTITLVAIILIYGYSSIKRLQNTAEKVACVKFKNDMQNAVETIQSDFGSVRKEEIELCSNYKKACFVNSFPVINKFSITTDPFIKDSLLSETGNNIFLVDNVAKESFYGGNISVDTDVLCIDDINNKISLRLEGLGDHVLLSQWT